MRESEGLTDELKERGKSDEPLQCPFYPNVMFARVLQNVRRLGRSTLQFPFLTNLTLSQLGVLFVALSKAGFPRPWNRLTAASKTELVSLLAGITKERLLGDKETYSPIIIEEGAAEFDPLENCWRLGQLEPSELNLFKITASGGTTERWEHSGRCFFFGFIRLDRGYNETDAVEAFRQEFRKRWSKTTGGGNPNWRARLKQLAVMRIWKHERNQWERLKLVAKICGYKGCKREAAEHKERGYRGHAKEPMSRGAKVEMSTAQANARTFFHELFPGDEPLSYRASREGKS
jgi:hypothetical protein